MKVLAIFVFAYSVYFLVCSYIFDYIGLSDDLSVWLLTFLPVLAVIAFAVRDLWKREHGS